MTVAPDGTSWFRLVDRRQVLGASAASALGFGFSDRDVSAAARQVASLEGFRALFDQFRQLGQTASPAVVLPALIAQTQTVQGIAAQSDARTQGPALRLTARYAEYVGWMCQEASHDEAALWWTDRAVELAAAGGDRDLASYALVRRALMALYRNDAAETVELSRRAQLGTVLPRIRGLAAQREAQGHALAGDREACLRCLDSARRLLALPPSDPAAPVLGSTNLTDPVAMITGWCLYDLGRPGEAAEVLDHARTTSPSCSPPSVTARCCSRSSGPAGSPRSMNRAATAFLYRLPGAKIQIRELPDGDPDEPVLDPDEVDSGQRLLLDLSTRDETFCAELLGQLPSYRDAVWDRGAHLVVVLPHSHKHYLGSELEPSVVDIVRPNGEEVFRRYLRYDGITRNAQLDVDELPTQLRSERMLRIAELAGLVQLARDSEPEQKFPHWLGEALKAWTERSNEVAAKVKDLRSGRQRALLLTTAMFSGAHADAIFASASRLCTLDQHPTDDRPRLEREDLAEQLAEIEATADAAGRVHFTLLGYDPMPLSLE